MDEAKAMRLSGQFLTGAFEKLNALLGSTFVHTPGKAVAGDATALAGWCDAYPVWIHARLAGSGAVAVLWTQDNAAALVARVGGEDPASRVTVTADDSALLQELSEALAGGGALALGELLGADITIEKAGYSLNGDAAALREALGDTLVGAEVEFRDESTEGKALFVYSAELEARLGGAEDAVVSEDEVRDILGGFTPEDETDHSARRNGEPLPDNLDVVMDIELLVTARLGKVEVPISEVLNYGPGSIIELGHVVDEPIELLVNGKLIARGDVVVVDERFGLRITEIVSPRERIESLR